MSIAALDKILDELNAEQAQHFDPVRFAFIQSLAKRLRIAQHANNTKLIAKTLSKAKQYRKDLSLRRTELGAVLDDLSNKFPQYTKAFNDLFEQCKFRELERLSVKLNTLQARQKSLLALSDLSSTVSQQTDNDDGTQLRLDEILYQQEQDARVAAGYTPPQKNDGRGDQLELQSMRIFRESMKYFNIDKTIARAIHDCPENPGPHNPQMLAIKSLVQMRELSPQYLRRFAGYIETVLWLEKNAAKLSGNKSGTK